MWAFLVFPLVFFIMPLGIGLLLIPSNNKAQVFITGLCASWSFYEILAILFHCTQWSLHVMTLIWLCICVGLAGVGYYSKRDAVVQWGQSFQCVQNRWELALWGLLIVLVFAQTLSMVLGAFYGNWDDSTYCSIATTSWYTDTANRYSPQSGEWGTVLYDGQYVLAAWPLLSASLAQLTGIHPAIIFRTLMPLVEVPLAYWILYLLARFFFVEDRKKAVATVIVAVVINLVTANQMGQNSAEWWLILNPWTGKAIASNIMVPMILWILFCMESVIGKLEHRNWWYTLFLACMASCFVAGTMFVLVPVELAIWGTFYLIRTRRWQESLYFFACGVFPLGCLFVVYRMAIVSLFR